MTLIEYLQKYHGMDAEYLESISKSENLDELITIATLHYETETWNYFWFVVGVIQGYLDKHGQRDARKALSARAHDPNPAFDGKRGDADGAFTIIRNLTA